MEHLKPGDVFLDTYEVRECLWKSKSELTFRVKDLISDKSYVLKAFKAQGTIDEEIRFRNAVSRASRISSRHVAAIHQYGVQEGYLYFIEEFIEGVPLSQLVEARKDRPFLPEEVESLISDLIVALDAVHSEIPHLLIHPDNVIVLADRAVLTDAGKALALPPEVVVHSEEEKGRPPVIFPPEFRNNSSTITTTADIYCLGVLLYMLFTGDYPREAEPSMPSEINEDLTVDVDDFVLGCMAAETNMRPASTKQFLVAFYELLGKEAPSRGSEAREFNIGEMLVEKSAVEEEDLMSLLSDLTGEEKKELEKVPPPVTVEEPEEPEIVISPPRSNVTLIVISALISAAVAAGAAYFVVRMKSAERSSISPPPPPATNKIAKGVTVPVKPSPLPGVPPSAKQAKTVEQNVPPKSPAPLTSAPVPLTKEQKKSAEKKREEKAIKTAAIPASRKGEKKPAPPPRKKRVHIPPAKKSVKKKKEPCPKGMVFIPGGSVIVGTPQDDEMWDPTDLSAKKVHLKAFCIDKYEYPNKKGKLPQAAVTWYEAKEMCQKEGKRLCTEEEWERACKGDKSFRFPYGNKWKSAYCVTEDARGRDRSLYPSGKARRCVSPFGVYDMSGNLAEWVADIFEKGLNDRTVKGGSYKRPDYAVRCASRMNAPPDTRDDEVGFRCCADTAK